MSSWLVYVFVKLDTITTLLSSVLIATTLLLCISFVGIVLTYSEDEYGNGNKKQMKTSLCVWLRWAKRGVIILIITAILYIAIPNSKQFAVIYLVPQIATNTDVQQLPSDIAKLLRHKMNEWLGTIEQIEEKVKL